MTDMPDFASKRNTSQIHRIIRTFLRQNSDPAMWDTARRSSNFQLTIDLTSHFLLRYMPRLADFPSRTTGKWELLSPGYRVRRYTTSSRWTKIRNCRAGSLKPVQLAPMQRQKSAQLIARARPGCLNATESSLLRSRYFHSIDFREQILGPVLYIREAVWLEVQS
jgi:hypothetical protein